jgi:hypothetical protein
VRRIGALGALVFVVALGGAAAGSSAESRPELEVVTIDPFRVGGTGFGSYERVRVTATLDGETTVVRRRAGRRGRFWARFADDACSATVQAVGGRGSKASLAFDHVMCRPTR